MQLTLADDRPAHLTKVHQALTALPEADQVRLGVTQDWDNGPHQLTYRQVEHTFGLAVKALSKTHPDGAPSDVLARTCDDLLEASIPAQHKHASAALSADWTDTETWSRPPRHGTTACADPEAPGGTATPTCPAPKARCSSATTSRRHHDARGNGPPVPELARRMTLTNCHLDPARALVPVLQRWPPPASRLGDILADSGYAHRDAAAWPSRSAPPARSWSRTCTPHDRGPQGTHHGAIIANGNLYCPATPAPLLELGPLAPRRHP